MEEHFPASLLVVAGLLRVAGAPRSEAWSSPATGQSSLEEGLATAAAHLAPVREEEITQVSLPLDSFTSSVPGSGFSHPHEIIRTEAGEISQGRGQPRTHPGRQPGRSGLTVTKGAISGHQSKDSPASWPQISRSTFRASSEMGAESASWPEALTTFLLGEEGTEDATGRDLSITEKGSSRVPPQAAETALLPTPVQAEPLASPGQMMTRDISPSLAPRPGSPHTVTSGTHATQSPGPLEETRLTPAQESLGSLLTSLPRDAQLVSGGRLTLDLRASELPGTPGLLLDPLLSSSAPPEGPGATQQPRLAFSPPGKVTGHGAVGLRSAETPAGPVSSQSSASSPSLVLAPETRSAGSPPWPARPGDASQRDRPRALFPSPPPMPDGAEGPRQASTPLASQQETQPETSLQTAHFELPRPPAAPQGLLSDSGGQEPAPEGPVPTQRQPQPSPGPATLYGPGRGRGLSTSPPRKATSAHAHPAALREAAAAAAASSAAAATSHAQPPLPHTSDAAEGVPPGGATRPVRSTSSPLAHSQPASLSTSAPPLPGAEPWALSPDSAPTQPPTPGTPAPVSAGPTRLSGRASLPTAPQLAPEERSAETAASASAQLPAAGSLGPVCAGPPSSAAAAPAHATPRASGGPTAAYGELQGRASGTPFPPEHQTPGSSAPGRAAIPETTVPSPVQTRAAAAELTVLATAALGLTKPQRSPRPSSPFDAVTQSLSSRTYGGLQSATPRVPDPGPRAPSLGVTLPTLFKSSPKPGAPAPLRKGPLLFATPVPARAQLKTKEARAEGSLPVSTEARAPLVLSVHTQNPHPLSHIAAPFGGKTVTLSAETPNAPVSPPVQLLRGLRSQPSSSSVFVQTETVLTSAEAAAPSPTVAPSAHPPAHLPTTLILPGTHRTSARKEVGKSSLQRSLPTSQPGIDGTPWPGCSAPENSQKVGGRGQSSDAPGPNRPASQTVPHQNVNPSVSSSVRLAEHFPSRRTNAILAGDEAQDLMQNSQGFLLHLLSQLEMTVDGNLESPVARSYPGIPAVLPDLSFLIRGADNMVCLQPMQNSTPPSGGLGAASFQEMLLSSSFLGLSHPGAPSLTPMSALRVLLVKPMLVLLPADASGDPVQHPAEDGEGRAVRHSSPNAAVLRWLASSHEQRAEGSSSPRQPSRAGSLSTNRQAVSGPVLSSVPDHAAGSKRARPAPLKAGPFPDLLKEVATVRTRSIENRNPEDRFLSSILDPAKSGEDNSNSLSTEHHASATPPVEAHQRPTALPPTTELLSPPLRIASVHSAVGRPASLGLGRAPWPEQSGSKSRLSDGELPRRRPARSDDDFPDG
ncbi:uncharacterized protein LOC143821540 [Paroedura picta]|uniref:uncharacterized protein LOC143821540 n=1 Tax=Paroedura picta TaxID=143630 RepID=UPI00405792BA